jgi:hypothetical protein
MFYATVRYAAAAPMKHGGKLDHQIKSPMRVSVDFNATRSTVPM